MTGRAGYASFGAHVHLRDDTPPLTRVIEAERVALAADGRSDNDARYDDGCGPVGPQGSEGFYDSTPYVVGPPMYGPMHAGPYFGPVGAIPPGLRTPRGSHRPHGFGMSAPVFTAPRSATPASDVWRHRPGLSTGSGIYARRDSR